MELKPSYKQTEVGLIPTEWNLRPLLSAVSIRSGQVDPKVEPYKSMTLVAPDHIESKTGRLLSRRTAADQHAISGKYLFQPGDIIYSKIRPYLRKAFLADFQGLCSADMYPLSAAPDVCSAFILAVLLGHRFSCFAENSSMRSGIPKINREELADYVVALPPKSEQCVIAKAFRDVDSLVGQLDVLIAKKRDVKQAVMQQLFTGQTRLPGFSGEWAMKRLGEIGSTFGGLTGKTKSDFGDGTARYITFMNIMTNVVIDPNTFEYVKVSPSESQNRVMRGDLFFNGSSETPEEVGMCAVLLEDDENVFLNSFCFGFRLRESVETNGLYLAYYFRSSEGRKLLFSLAQGPIRYNLSKTTLLKLKFPLPSFTEQTAITAVLSDMDAEIAALEKRRDKTQILKKAMMQELLTGKTRLI